MLRGLVEALGLFAFPRRIGADAASFGFYYCSVNLMNAVDVLGNVENSGDR